MHPKTGDVGRKDAESGVSLCAGAQQAQSGLAIYISIRQVALLA